MVTVVKNGLTDQSMKGNGLTIKLTETANLFMLMATSMKENGRMIKQMDKAITFMLTVLIILVNGKMTSSMAMALKCGLMGQFMRDSTSRGRKTAKVD